MLGTVDTHPLTDLIKAELSSYFKNPCHRFQLPFKSTGSVYQKKVWEALTRIPSGQPLTYGELACLLQSSPRAIGQACKRNPLALFVPCHRVIGRNNVGGYMGDAACLSYKSALLAHESHRNHHAIPLFSASAH